MMPVLARLCVGRAIGGHVNPVTSSMMPVLARLCVGGVGLDIAYLVLRADEPQENHAETGPSLRRARKRTTSMSQVGLPSGRASRH